jgi:hypothetical protein
VLASTDGTLLLGEPITLRYILASIVVLGGIALVVATPGKEGLVTDRAPTIVRARDGTIIEASEWKIAGSNRGGAQESKRPRDVEQVL